MKKSYKKIAMMLVGAFALVAFPNVVKAATTFELQCGDQAPSKPGDGIACSLRVNSSEGVDSLKVKIEPDSQLTLNRVVYDETIWSQGNVDSSGYVQLTTMSTPITNGNIANISGTWKENASECGKMCVSILYTIAGSTTEQSAVPTGNYVSETGKCGITKAPVKETDPKSPETGRFSDYAVLVGGCAIAIAAISVARRSTKFYRV